MTFFLFLFPPFIASPPFLLPFLHDPLKSAFCCCLQTLRTLSLSLSNTYIVILGLSANSKPIWTLLPQKGAERCVPVFVGPCCLLIRRRYIVRRRRIKPQHCYHLPCSNHPKLPIFIISSHQLIYPKGQRCCRFLRNFPLGWISDSPSSIKKSAKQVKALHPDWIHRRWNYSLSIFSFYLATNLRARN